MLPAATLLALLLATQPSATQPSATQPSATQPSATQPSATQPSATQPSATQPSATQPTWVFFADKPDPDPNALADAERELSPRALDRRRRLRGDRGVDLRDVPPAAAYVDAVLETGVTLRTTSRWLNAISVETRAEQRDRIARLPGVDRVTAVARGQRQPAPEARSSDPTASLSSEPLALAAGLAQAQLELLGVPTLHACGLRGEGVLIGVQDSGFNLTHQAFAGANVVAARDFLRGDDIVADQDDDVPGQHNHGTSVLSLIIGDDGDTFLGVAPHASVILAKTEDVVNESQIEEDYYVAGLEWIEGMGADLFTASLGYIDWYTYADFDGQTSVTAKASAIAIDNGLIMFTAIGNSGPNPATLITPSDVDGMITIGATTLQGEIAGFSSRGPTADGRVKPDLVAPGAGVTTVQPNSADKYGNGNGTSYAAPLAAGVGVLLKQAYPDLGPAQMLDLMRSTANGPMMPNNDEGWGLIDAVAAAELYCNCPDDDDDGHHDVRCGGDDCDDHNASRYPGAAELCDGLDNNCDGDLPSDEVDGDRDGYLACEECDDDNIAIHPAAIELQGDCIDNNCDGLGEEECDGTSGSATGGSSTTDPIGTSGVDPTMSASASSATTSESAGEDAQLGGCGCSGGSPIAPGWGALLLLGLARRRRRSA